MAAGAPSVSAVVLTYNEEELVPHTLARLLWADEILVVDSFSKDRTRELAAAAGANVRVLTHEFRNFSEQFNWGIAQAAGDWIFMVDADELVEPALRDSVLATVRSAPGEDIFLLRRDSYVFGHRMRASSWSGEWIPRLFRRGAVEYAGEVHPDLQIGDRPTGRLDGILLHYTYRSAAKYFEKFQLYSTLWAEKAYASGRRTSVPEAVVSSIWRVFHNYCIRGEIRDGTVGFLMSVLGGMHTFIRHMKLWGMQHAGEIGAIHDRPALPEENSHDADADRQG